MSYYATMPFTVVRGDENNNKEQSDSELTEQSGNNEVVETIIVEIEISSEVLLQEIGRLRKAVFDLGGQELLETTKQIVPIEGGGIADALTGEILMTHPEIIEHLEDLTPAGIEFIINDHNAQKEFGAYWKKFGKLSLFKQIWELWKKRRLKKKIFGNLEF